MYPDFQLAMAGDEWVSYQQMLEEAAQLHVIKAMLDERFPWTAECNTVAGRVEAVMIAYELRSVKEVENER